MQSRIVIASTTWWPAPARLAAEFRDLGAWVGAICPARSPLLYVCNDEATFQYSAIAPIASLSAMLRRSVPDLVVPTDDRALTHLHMLHRSSPIDSPVRRLIERSLGDATHFEEARSRAGSMRLADAASVREPATRALMNEADVRAWCAERSMPALMKADGSWGGNGVVIVDNVDAALAAFQRLTQPIPTGHVMSEWLLHRDPYPLYTWLHRKRPAVVGQDFVRGQQANIMVACWRGEVLASAAVKVMETTREFGAATVVEPIDHPGIRDAAVRLVRSLGTSGFCGLDFVIDDRTGEAMMIELNPRATQLGHLAFTGSGTLAGALLARLRGESWKASRPAITQDRIAFFPQAWMTGAPLERLRGVYRDVPWNEKQLLSHLVQRLGDDRSLVQRLVDRLLHRRDPAELMAAFQTRMDALRDEPVASDGRPWEMRREAVSPLSVNVTTAGAIAQPVAVSHK